MKKTAFLFPGQGAQYVGMGKDFYDAYEEAKQVFNLADELLGYKLSEIIFQGPIEKLTLTEYSQPAIFVVACAILTVLRKEAPHIRPSICAGLSLGEYTALYAAGKISFKDALLLLQKRAELMSMACKKNPGTMAAVLGLTKEKLADALSGIDQVWTANFNAPGQIVISGSVEGIEKAESKLQEAGAKRVLRIDVAGAFHSGLMKEAKEKLSPAIKNSCFSFTDIEVVMNVTAKPCSDILELKELLTKQLTGSVNWEDSIKYMQSQNVEAYLEIGPGKILCGLNKKIGVLQSCYSLESFFDLTKLLQDIKHAQK